MIDAEKGWNKILGKIAWNPSQDASPHVMFMHAKRDADWFRGRFVGRLEEFIDSWFLIRNFIGRRSVLCPAREYK